MMLASVQPIFSHTADNLLFGSLLISALSPWFFSRPFVLLLAAGTTLIAFFAHRIDWIGMINLGLMALSIRMYYQGSRQLWNKLLLGVLLGLSIPLFFFHLVPGFDPGFHNALLIDNIRLSPDSLPYRLYLNTDKVLTGLMLFVYGCFPNRTLSEWSQSLRVIALPLCIVAVVLIGGALALGYVRTDFKLPAMVWIWAPVNLLFVCLAEEAFFRGFLQKEGTRALSSIKGGQWIALGLASVLFGLYHYRGGPSYVLLATLAGAGYGYVYKRSGRLESSILLHFLVNFIHFIGFSYPALDPSLFIK